MDASVTGKSKCQLALPDLLPDILNVVCQGRSPKNLVSLRPR